MNACVSVLLATFNGARFLGEQLASLAAQDVARLDVSVSDDGSTDGTRALLEQWAATWRKGRFVIAAGPGQGFAENFRALALIPQPEADYVAFCDQDDIWQPGKLSAAIAALSANAADRPAVYFSRTRLIDDSGQTIGYSHRFSRPPGFGNALVQSIGGGNTTVFNRRGFSLFAASAARAPFLFHDWWGYIIVSGAGGYVHYDPEPHILYRQHGGNQLGQDMSAGARAGRLRGQFEGGLRGWDDANLASLQASSDLLTQEARDIVAEFTRLRQSQGLAALVRLLRSPIRRQTAMGNVSLGLAAMLGRL
ncbi:MAG: glycosyltransferase family 2 protein [Devosia sp.]|nr:glycosyltransferase family 2 protein [Devosia sp.]